jgi:hypothetical protein
MNNDIFTNCPQIILLRPLLFPTKVIH